MTFQELLQERAKQLDAQKSLVNKAENENRGFNEDEQKQFNEIDKSIADLDSRIESQKSISDKENKFNMNPSTFVTGEKGKDHFDDGGYKSFGEFVVAVKTNKAISVTDNGVLVPPAYSNQIMALQPQAGIVAPRAMDLSDGTDAALHIPAMAQGTSGVFGGVTVYNLDENASVTETSATIGDVTLTPTRKAALITVSNMLIQNNTTATNTLMTMLRNGIVASEDYDCLRGNGTGCALGVIAAPATISVNRNTSTDVKWVDVATMAGKLNPNGGGLPVWVINQSAKTKIIQMVDAGNHSVFVNGDASKGIPDLLLGYPIVWTGRTPALGTKGDVLLCDFSGYVLKRGTMYMAMSEHTGDNFLKGQTSIKVTEFFDGTPWVTAPLTLEDGATTVSHFVTLN